MVQVSFDGKSLRIEDREVELEYPIRDAFEYHDIIVVVQNPPTDEDVRDNVVAFTEAGERVWTIEPPTTEDVTGAVVYTSVHVDEGSLVARTWSGDEYWVDSETGEMEYRRFIK